MRFASRCCPSRSFPSPGSRARSRGSVLPCGFALRPSSGAASQVLHDRFPRRASSGEPGQRFLAVASPVASTHPKVPRTCRPLPVNAGLAVLRTVRPLRSFAPPGGPFRSTLALAGESLSAGALLGLSPSRAFSTNDPGSGVSRRRAFGARYPGQDGCPGPRLRAPGIRGCSREPSTDPGFMNPGSVDAPRLRTGARYRRAVARAPSRRHPAPSCPSRHAPPPRGARRWTSKTLVWDRLRRLRVFRTRRDPPLTGADRWWAFLLPGRPALLGFRPSSTASLRTRGPTRRARFGDSSSVNRTALDPGELLTDPSDITSAIWN